MTEAVSLAILAVAGTLLGTAIGVIGTYFVSIHLARNHAKSLVGQRLRDAFAPEIFKVKISDTERTYQAPDILNAAFEKHYMAVNEFEFFLNPKEHIAFTKAWEKYASRNSDEKRFEKYLVSPEEAIDNIYAILDFTKH
jgi:hypothetical protein